MPATRSKELRDLCDRMLTLDWQKRPSINDILATPVMKARIQKFLSATLVVSDGYVKLSSNRQPRKLCALMWLKLHVCGHRHMSSATPSSMDGQSQASLWWEVVQELHLCLLLLLLLLLLQAWVSYSC